MEAHSYDVICKKKNEVSQTPSSTQKIQQQQSKYGFTDPLYLSGREENF